MSAGTCQVCKPKHSKCVGKDDDPLATLDIRTRPGGQSCSIASQPKKKGQEVVVDSTKTKHVDVIVEVFTNHSSVNVHGKSRKKISVPAGSADNNKCFHLSCTSGNCPQMVGLKIEVTLDRGKGRPRSNLTTLNVKRRP